MTSQTTPAHNRLVLERNLTVALEPLEYLAQLGDHLVVTRFARERGVGGREQAGSEAVEIQALEIFEPLFSMRIGEETADHLKNIFSLVCPVLFVVRAERLQQVLVGARKV